MSVDIISAPVRVRPKGGQIPKQSVRSRQEGHVWRTWHNINRHYVHDGSRPLMADNIKLQRKGIFHMFRLWAKIIKDNHLLKDTVICDGSSDTRTHKVFRALDEIVYQFDLGKPIWLDATVNEFKRHDKARFYQDNFIEPIDFDYLEIHVIEED